MGVWNAHTNVGNVLGSIIAAFYVNHQWGASFVVPGLLLLIFAYVVFIVLVDHPDPDLNLDVTPARTLEPRTKVAPGYYRDVKVQLFGFYIYFKF